MEIFNFREFDSRFNNEVLSVINDKLKLIKDKKIDFKCFSDEATEVPAWISAVFKRYFES